MVTMDNRNLDANGNPKSLLDQIPQWLKSLHEMENELRNAARKGIILRKDEASQHLAEARFHLTLMGAFVGAPCSILRYRRKSSTR
jgi:hypothetical protein